MKHTLLLNIPELTILELVHWNVVRSDRITHDSALSRTAFGSTRESVEVNII